MRHGLCFLTAAALCGMAASRGGLRGADQPGKTCEPGFKIVEEVCYKDVVKKVCKVVPDVKKIEKWVYDCKTVDFCLPKCGLHGGHGHDCDKCPACLQCGHPMSKKVLIKRKVVEEVKTEKCVVESVVERVAYTVCRKVPCGQAAATPETLNPPAGAVRNSTK